MPVDMKRYPPNWREIVASIRERAGNKCEWCGVPNGEIGARDRYGVWRNERAIHVMNSTEGAYAYGEFPKMIRIVLTTAHLGTAHADGRPGDKHDKLDCRPENLAYLCQRCHLNYDRDEHIANAKATRRRKRLEATGQMEMPL